MNALATILRTAQFQAHAFHQLISGINFLELHEFLGKAYGEYEGHYDDVVERMIGLGQAVNPSDLTVKGAQRAAMGNTNGAATSPTDMLRRVLTMEQAVMSAAESENEGASLGTQDLLQKIANASEMRMYRLKQLLKTAGSITT